MILPITKDVIQEYVEMVKTKENRIISEKNMELILMLTNQINEAYYQGCIEGRKAAQKLLKNKKTRNNSESFRKRKKLLRFFLKKRKLLKKIFQKNKKIIRKILKKYFKKIKKRFLKW